MDIEPFIELWLSTKNVNVNHEADDRIVAYLYRQQNCHIVAYVAAVVAFPDFDLFEVPALARSLHVGDVQK